MLSVLSVISNLNFYLFFFRLVVLQNFSGTHLFFMTELFHCTLMKRFTVLLAAIFAFLTSVTAVVISAPADAVVITDDISDGVFYTQIWFWILAGLAFMILVVAMLRGDSKS